MKAPVFLLLFRSLGLDRWSVTGDGTQLHVTTKTGTQLHVTNEAATCHHLDWYTTTHHHLDWTQLRVTTYTGTHAI